MRFRCITAKYGNFTHGKVYEGRVKFVHLNKEPATIVIDDDEHDSFAVWQDGKTYKGFVKEEGK